MDDSAIYKNRDRSRSNTLNTTNTRYALMKQSLSVTENELQEKNEMLERSLLIGKKLSKQNKHQKSEIKRLEGELQDVLKKMNESVENINYLESRIETIESENSQLLLKVDDLEYENQKLIAKEKEHVNTVMVKEEMKKKLSNFSRQLQRAKSELKDKKRVMEIKETELQRLKDNSPKIIRALRAKTPKMRKLRKDITALTEEKELLEMRVQQLSVSRKLAFEEKEEMTQEFNVLAEKLTDVQMTKQHLIDDLKTKEVESKELTKEKENLNQSLVKLQEILHLRQKDVSELEKIMKIKEKKIEKIEESFNEKNLESESKIKNLLLDVETTKKIKKKLETDLRRKENRYKEIQEEKKDIVGLLGTTKSNMSKIRRNLQVSEVKFMEKKKRGKILSIIKETQEKLANDIASIERCLKEVKQREIERIEMEKKQALEKEHSSPNNDNINDTQNGANSNINVKEKKNINMKKISNKEGSENEIDYLEKKDEQTKLSRVCLAMSIGGMIGNSIGGMANHKALGTITGSLTSGTLSLLWNKNTLNSIPKSTLFYGVLGLSMGMTQEILSNRIHTFNVFSTSILNILFSFRKYFNFVNHSIPKGYYTLFNTFSMCFIGMLIGRRNKMKMIEKKGNEIGRKESIGIVIMLSLGGYGIFKTMGTKMMNVDFNKVKGFFKYLISFGKRNENVNEEQ